MSEITTVVTAANANQILADQIKILQFIPQGWAKNELQLKVGNAVIDAFNKYQAWPWVDENLMKAFFAELDAVAQDEKERLARKAKIEGFVLTVVGAFVPIAAAAGAFVTTKSNTTSAANLTASEADILNKLQNGVPQPTGGNYAATGAANAGLLPKIGSTGTIVLSVLSVAAIAGLFAMAKKEEKKLQNSKKSKS